MHYRPDIDGLRAIAVGSVVLYHAGVPFFPAGFLGVDVFFVISGYLITGILLDELRSGSFSILAFYERRIRRIIPALAVMLAATSLAALVVLFPEDLKTFAKTMAAAILFVSNLFLADNSGYFGGNAHDNPLTHTWSLAVEEQFYILLPLALWLLWRFRLVLPGLVLVFGLSLASAVILAPRDPASAFYLPHFRFWELLAGSLIAFARTRAAPPAAIAPAAGVIGLAAIIASLTLLGQSRAGVPGLWTLPAVLGSALLIWSGARPTPAARLLATRPLVGLGLVSYSLYLWHWPVFVLYRHATARPATSAELALLILLSLLLAAASWRFVERPFRKPSVRIPRRRLFAFAGATFAALLCLSWATHGPNGWPNRYPPAISTILTERARYDDSTARSCLQGPLRDLAAPTPDEFLRLACRFGADGPPDVILWGDSHAGALIPALQETDFGPLSGLAIVRPGCPPVADLVPSRERKVIANVRECLKFNEAVGAFLRSHPPKAVFLVGRWAFHLDHAAIARAEVEPDARYDAAAFADALVAHVRALRAAGIRVVILDPMPFPGFDVPNRIAADLSAGSPITPGPSRADYLRDNAESLAVLGRIGDAVRISPLDALCPAGRCILWDGSAVLYADTDHLALAGARRLMPAIIRALSGG
jgi:peptidoglycan/LPS O-acetylase OafA/YrhL